MLIKFRHKVSFLAFTNSVTIQELFLKSILRSHRKLIEDKSIIVSDKEQFKQQLIVQTILTNSETSYVERLDKINSITNE